MSKVKRNEKKLLPARVPSGSSTLKGTEQFFNLIVKSYRRFRGLVGDFLVLSGIIADFRRLAGISRDFRVSDFTLRCNLRLQRFTCSSLVPIRYIYRVPCSVQKPLNLTGSSLPYCVSVLILFVPFQSCEC